MKDKRVDEKLVLLRLPDELAARIDAAMEVGGENSLYLFIFSLSLS